MMETHSLVSCPKCTHIDQQRRPLLTKSSRSNEIDISNENLFKIEVLGYKKTKEPTTLAAQALTQEKSERQGNEGYGSGGDAAMKSRTTMAMKRED
jgi:hypothetical protein